MAIIKGTGSADVLTGTTGNDTILAGLGGDTINGTAGSDTINAGFKTSAYYWRYGFIDNDVVNYENTWASFGLASDTALRIAVDLQLGKVSKINAATGVVLGTDTLIGVDRVYGTDANDTFKGRDFWDFEEFRTFGGNDGVDGRGGYDGVDYSYFTVGSSIRVNLAAGTVSKGPGLFTDTLRQVEIITGTNQNDVYVATGFGGASLNRNSYGEDFNLFSPRAGNDTVSGNGGTAINYNGVGGKISVNLGLLTSATAVAQIRTAYVDDTTTTAGFAAGTLTASGVNSVRGGAYDDSLTGGGRVNTSGSATTVSGDRSFEAFRGNGGNDIINGRTGVDRADYNTGGQSEGIVVNLAAGTVRGDPLLTGSDTLRGIESITGTYLDDVYSAVGFTLSNVTAPSRNSGDAIVTAPTGETLASTAYNEFRAIGGNDSVTGNGATRVSFSNMGLENKVGTSVIVTFTTADDGTAVYGLTDGGLGTVDFTGVFSVTGGAGNDSMTGAAGFQNLRGYYGNDTIVGGAGADMLFGHNGETTGRALNRSTTFTDDDRLDGGSGNDLLRGDFGADVLIGGVGNDTLEGGTGADSLTGGSGLDQFRFAAANVGVDRIADFVSGSDDIVVTAANFGLTAGAAARVVVNGAATTASGTFLYNSTTGALAFDADGTGAGAAVQFAILANKPATLVAADFVLS